MNWYGIQIQTFVCNILLGTDTLVLMENQLATQINDQIHLEVNIHQATINSKGFSG